MQTRIVRRLSVDNPPKPYYVVQEIVTTTGLHIEWSEIYHSEEAARKSIESYAAIHGISHSPVQLSDCQGTGK